MCFRIYKTVVMGSLETRRSSFVRQKRDSNIAMMLVTIVAVFAVCNTLRVIINVFEVTVD